MVGNRGNVEILAIEGFDFFEVGRILKSRYELMGTNGEKYRISRNHMKPLFYILFPHHNNIQESDTT